MYAYLGFDRSCRVYISSTGFSQLMTRPCKDFVVMDRETHNHNNDQHTIDIPSDDDSSSGSSLIYSSARTSPSTDDNDIDQHVIDTPNYGASSSSLSQFTDEETPDEGSSLGTIGWNSMEFVFTVVQIVAALLVWSTIAKDEHPQALLSAWLIVYTCGCITDALLLSWAIDDLVGEYPGTRVGRVMEKLKIWLGCFFVVWSILGILWICFSHSSPSDAPNLYRLCIAFIAFSCTRFSAALLLLLCEDSVGEGQGGGSVFQGTITDDCCSICLEKYGGKKKVIRKLECSHIFHLDCIDKWLIVKSTCPLCQSLVGG